MKFAVLVCWLMTYPISIPTQLTRPTQQKAAPGLQSLSPLAPNWQYIAEADQILVATVDKIEVRRVSTESGNPGSGTSSAFDVTTRVGERLKGTGTLPALLNLTLTGASVQGEVAQRYFEQLPGKKVLLLVDDEQPQYWHLARYDDLPGGILLATPERIRAVVRELSNQRRIHSEFDKLPVARPDRYDAIVRREVKRLTIKATKQGAVTRLITLGGGAIPALIRNLNNHTSLPRSLVGVLAPPESFEAINYYGPETVTDALTLVLDHILQNPVHTHLWSGGTTQQRHNAVIAWRCYLVYEFAKLQSGKVPTRPYDLSRPDSRPRAIPH